MRRTPWRLPKKKNCQRKTDKVTWGSRSSPETYSKYLAWRGAKKNRYLIYLLLGRRKLRGYQHQTRDQVTKWSKTRDSFLLNLFYIFCAKNHKKLFYLKKKLFWNFNAVVIIIWEGLVKRWRQHKILVMAPFNSIGMVVGAKGILPPPENPRVRITPPPPCSQP